MIPALREQVGIQNTLLSIIMKIVTNEGLIQRNARIGQVTSLAGLIILLAATYLNFRNPEQVGLLWAGVLAGFLLSQVGIYFGNRYVRRPRPDELINKALKGLNRRYTLYHYSTPSSHLLVGPAGIWVLSPQHQRGVISYESGRWRQRGGGVFLLLQKIFAQEGLGRPDRKVAEEVSSLERSMRQELGEDEIPQINGAILFTNDAAQIDANGSPVPALHTRKLKDFIRKQAKEKRLSAEKAQRINQLFELEG